MAWLTGWTYRKSITLARASGVVTNYQMKLLIGESSGATGEDVDCGGHCLSTFNDLRFTTSDGTTLLDYWIESISDTTPNQLATVWIEFDSIGTSDTTFYMYYGNSGASAVSSGVNTFLLFDHFDDGTINTSIWDTAGTPTESGTALTLNQSDERLSSKSTFGPYDVCVRAKVKLAQASGTYYGVIGFRYHDGTDGVLQAISNYKYTGFDVFAAVKTGTTWGNTLGNVNVEKILDISWLSSSAAKARYDDGLWDTIITNIPTAAALPVIISVFSASTTLTCDWVLIRNIRETEPAWGTWGVEYSTAEYYSVSITADPLSVTASLSGTPWPSLQQIIPAALSVTAGLLITSVSTQMVIAPAALSATAELSCGDITSFASANIVTTYECYLSKPTYADLALPMSSFQGRIKSGDPSMLSVVIPGEDKFEDINDRSGGTLKLYIVKTAASNKVKELLIAVTLEDIRIDKGTENISISLSGHATVTYTPKIVVIKDLYYENIINGLRRWRFNPYVYLRPGDTVYIDGSTIVADDISWSVSENSFAMECAERTGGGTALDTTAAWVLKADSSPSSGGALAM